MCPVTVRDQVPHVDPHLTLTYLPIALNGIWPDLVYICVEENALRLSQVSKLGAVYKITPVFIFFLFFSFLQVMYF